MGMKQCSYCLWWAPEEEFEEVIKRYMELENVYKKAMLQTYMDRRKNLGDSEKTIARTRFPDLEGMCKNCFVGFFIPEGVA